MMTMEDKIIKDLIAGNKIYSEKNKSTIKKYKKKQSPKVAILTCSDSRVIPEYIFNKSIGELFIIRVVGNVAIENSVLKSIEYAVDQLKVNHVIILGHTDCGAVKASEETKENDNFLLNEIKKSFKLDKNHFKANILRQIEMMPKRSEIIKEKIDKNNLKLIGALYKIETGNVEFIID